MTEQAIEQVAVPVAEDVAKALAPDAEKLAADLAARAEHDEHPALQHFAGLRQLLARGVHADFAELERALTDLEADMRRALANCHHGDTTPATVTVHLTSEGNPHV